MESGFGLKDLNQRIPWTEITLDLRAIDDVLHLHARP